MSNRKNKREPTLLEFLEENRRDIEKWPSALVTWKPGGKTITAGLKWLGGRLANRARDARQAEGSARRLNPVGYPYALRLAEAHARAAEVYEKAVAEVARELEQEGGAR